MSYVWSIKDNDLYLKVVTTYEYTEDRNQATILDELPEQFDGLKRLEEAGLFEKYPASEGRVVLIKQG